MVTQKDVFGRTTEVQVNGHRVVLDHLDSLGMLLASCYDADQRPCLDNQRGLCHHSISALLEATKAAGVNVTTCQRQDAADLLARQLGGRVACCFRSGQDGGQSQQWVVVGRVQ